MTINEPVSYTHLDVYKRQGAASLCLNDQGGQRMDVTDDVTATLLSLIHIYLTSSG